MVRADNVKVTIWNVPLFCGVATLSSVSQLPLSPIAARSLMMPGPPLSELWSDEEHMIVSDLCCTCSWLCIPKGCVEIDTYREWATNHNSIHCGSGIGTLTNEASLWKQRDEVWQQNNDNFGDSCQKHCTFEIALLTQKHCTFISQQLPNS